MEQDLQAEHDRLLAMKPDDVVHEPCRFCKDDAPGGTGPMDFTAEQQAEIQKQIDSAVAAATAGLTAKLTELQAADAEAAIQAKVDEAVAKVAGEKAELQTQLDEAVAAKAAAEQTLADTTAYLEAEAAAEKAKEEADARKESRIAEVAAVIAFPDEHVQKRADGWAEMSDEAFTAELESYKVLAEAHNLKPKAPATAGDGSGAPKTRTALTAKETPAGGAGDGKKLSSATREAMGLRNRGIKAAELV